MNARTLHILETDGEGSSTLALQLCQYSALVHTAGAPAEQLLDRGAALMAALAAVEFAAMRAAIEVSALSVSSISARLLRHPSEEVIDAAAALIAALSGQGRHTTTLELPGCGSLRLVEQPGGAGADDDRVIAALRVDRDQRDARLGLARAEDVSRVDACSPVVGEAAFAHAVLAQLRDEADVAAELGRRHRLGRSRHWHHSCRRYYHLGGCVCVCV